MNKQDEQDKLIIEELEKFSIAEPSLELKSVALNAATEAWKTADETIGEGEDLGVEEPSLELKSRVLDAAADAWEDSDNIIDDVPWTYPVLRLAASLVVAASIVVASNMIGQNPRSGNAVSAPSQPDPTLLEITGIRRLTAVSKGIGKKDTDKRIIEYQQQLRKMLNSNG